MKVREHHAPVGALRLDGGGVVVVHDFLVREHHAPVGALRQLDDLESEAKHGSQGAPRTCRCIETLILSAMVSKLLSVREHHAPVGALRQGILRR